MNGRRAVVGLSLLCALVFSAFAASSASAIGVTAFTCVPTEGGAGFSKAHCAKADAVASGAKFKHVEIAPGVATEITGSNANTDATTTGSTAVQFTGTAAGVSITIVCQKAVTTGTLTNNAGPPMSVSGTGTSTYSECVTTIEESAKPNACKVKEPIVVETKANSVIEGATDWGKFEPTVAGGAFTTLFFENNGAEVCPEVLKNPAGLKVTGSAAAETDGATLVFTTGDARGSLKFGGNAAKFAVKTTGRNKVSNTPISGTTTAS